MSNPIATVAAPAAERTEEQIIREMSALATRMTLLEFELKRLRNPAGQTFADLEGIWAGASVTDEEIDGSKFRIPAKVEEGL